MSLISRIARVVSSLALATFALSFALELTIRATPLPDVSRARWQSQLVAASDGQIMWGFLAADDKWRISTKRSDVDPVYVDMLIAYEDKRFWTHHGVDLIAMVRAGLQAIRYRRVVSGGSTLTMQVVRMLNPGPHSLRSKISQIFTALALERSMSKNEILDLYLTLAPFGGNVEGVRTASELYFGKGPKHLSLSEAAVLTALPQAPEERRPDRRGSAAKAGRNRVLTILSSRGVIDRKLALGAMKDPLSSIQRSFLEHAPHFAMLLRRKAPVPDTRIVPTLVDINLQRAVESIAAHAIKSWGSAVNIAIVVLRNRDASVAAYLGGVDLSTERKGFVDLVQATRSPGSALKPFIYAMAFEKLIVHPDTIITDQPTELFGYSPENADGQYLGDISVRQALVRSRNTIAVMLLDRVGIESFLARFRSTGRPIVLRTSDSRAGLAVALGGAGVSLEQLTWFYTVFPNAGILRAIRYGPSDSNVAFGQLITSAAAGATADILADVPAPVGYVKQLSSDGGRRIGFKTGTSYGFRDAWAVGFDRLHTVGIWVGRPDGAAHFGTYGATAAAPILMQVFDQLPMPREDVGAGATDLGSLTSYRGLPPRLERFNGPRRDNPYTLQITFPRDGSEIHADRSADGAVDLPLTVTGGKPPYQWTLAGVAQPPSPLTVKPWSLDGHGQIEISVIDEDGAVAKSSFWLD